MIATYSIAGGLLGVAGYLGTKLSKKAASKVAMYSGKKYVEGQVSKADKKAKAAYEIIDELSAEEYLAKFKYAGMSDKQKDDIKKYKLRKKSNGDNLRFVLKSNEEEQVTPANNFKLFSELLDAFVLFYSNLSGKQGKYFNSKADPDKKYANVLKQLETIDENLIAYAKKQKELEKNNKEQSPETEKSESEDK
jgi:hypothetical protein